MRVAHTATHTHTHTHTPHRSLTGVGSPDVCEDKRRDNLAGQTCEVLIVPVHTPKHFAMLRTLATVAGLEWQAKQTNTHVCVYVCVHVPTMLG